MKRIHSNTRRSLSCGLLSLGAVLGSYDLHRTGTREAVNVSLTQAGNSLLAIGGVPAFQAPSGSIDFIEEVFVADFRSVDQWFTLLEGASSVNPEATCKADAMALNGPTGTGPSCCRSAGGCGFFANGCPAGTAPTPCPCNPPV